MIIAVAGPYSAPNEIKRSDNLDVLNAAAAEVYKKGHIPFIGVNAGILVADKLPGHDRREVINDISFALVDKCDAILMIGSSPGSNKEMEIIQAKGKPVYFHVNDIPLSNLRIE
jgi:nucleoside 2-deoxyribosyltransferase